MKTLRQQVFQPIENYGLIGNLCTAALVGMDSSIDFLCFPEFDSPTVFAALLDPNRGGSFSIRPQISGVQSKQMYAAESNVLITRFLSDDVTAEIIDFMPLTVSTQKSELVRIVRVIQGRIPFRLTCQPAFDYARSAHEADPNSAQLFAGAFTRGCEHCLHTIKRLGNVRDENWINSIARQRLTKTLSSLFTIGCHLGKLTLARLEFWCGRGDLNSHALAGAATSRLCVCQFRHFRSTQRHTYSSFITS